MKNLFNTVILLFALSNWAQEFKPGLYQAEPKYGQMRLKINEDKTYELITFYGKYEKSNDSLVLNNNYQGNSTFTIKSIKKDKKIKSDKIKLILNNLGYTADLVKIETSAIDNKEFDGKPVSDYIDSKNSPDNNGVVIELQKNNFLKIYYDNYKTEDLFVFEIPADAYEIEMEYNYDIYGNVKLKAYYDTNSNLILSEQSNKQPLVFRPITDDYWKKDETIKPKNIYSIKSKNSYETSSQAVDSVAAVADYAVEANAYQFKATEEKSWKEALTKIKNDTLKTLIIYFNENENKGKKAFESFISNYNYSMSSTMYNGYDPKFDFYNFYLANKNDKKLIEKLGIKKFPAIFAVDKNNTLLWRREIDLEQEYYSLLNNYDVSHQEVQKARGNNILNNVLKDKKTNLSEFKKLLIAQCSSDTSYLLPPPAVEEVPDMVEPKPVKEEVIEETKTEAFVTEPISDNIMIKSSFVKSDFEKKYKELIESEIKQNKFDKTFAKTVLLNLYNNNVYQYFFSENSYNFTKFNVHDLKYLSAYKKEYLDPNVDGYTEYGASPNNAFTQALNKIFDKEVSKDEVNTMTLKFIESTDYNPYYFSSYSQFLKNNYPENIDKQIIFAEKAMKIASSKPSLIEYLDSFYTAQNLSNDIQWTYFKNEYSNFYNSVAWNIFENRYIQFFDRVIPLSEFSLKIDKENAYYLDTLANLYFEKGRKNEAIELQEKAIKIAKAKNIDSTDFEKALIKMKQ